MCYKIMNGKEKGKFRRSKNWLNFKKYIDKLQPVDQLTKKKLSKRHQLHHLNLDPDKYTILEENYFLNLNPESHKIIHWIYSRYVKDPLIIDRLKEIIDKMYAINNGKDIKDYLK